MAEVAGTLLEHRKRLNEIARVLAHHGLAALGGTRAVHRRLAPVEQPVRRARAARGAGSPKVSGFGVR